MKILWCRIIWLHVELVGLGSFSTMESFASWRSMALEWRRRKGDWRRHFKEKMSQEQAHYHRKSWIRAWRQEEMSGGRERGGNKNFMPQMRSELWSLISQMIKVEKTHTRPLFIDRLSITQNWRKIWISIKFHLNLNLNLWSQNFTNYD